MTKKLVWAKSRRRASPPDQLLLHEILEIVFVLGWGRKKSFARFFLPQPRTNPISIITGTIWGGRSGAPLPPQIETCNYEIGFFFIHDVLFGLVVEAKRSSAPSPPPPNQNYIFKEKRPFIVR